jgi:pilus assembly protein CpaF
MVSMAGLNLPTSALRHQISSAIDVVIQVSRLSDGRRRIVSVSEVVGMEADIITMQDIFVFERTGVGEQGEVLGRFRPTGIRPRFADRLLVAGIKLPADLFGCWFPSTPPRPMMAPRPAGRGSPRLRLLLLSRFFLV